MEDIIVCDGSHWTLWCLWLPKRDPWEHDWKCGFEELLRRRG